jgi:DNA-binding MarR family transcriptional regulator
MVTKSTRKVTRRRRRRSVGRSGDELRGAVETIGPRNCSYRRARHNVLRALAMRRPMRDAALVDDHLTDPHMLVRDLLRDGTVATADDVAEHLGLDVSRVIALLDDLVRGGFIRPAVTTH